MEEIQHIWDIIKSLILITLDEEVKSEIFSFYRRCEEVCIMLMGHHYQPVRESGVRLLNVLYDGNDWQCESPFKCEIKSVGDEFIIKSPYMYIYIY